MLMLLLLFFFFFFFLNMDFFKLHSQMNPHLRAWADSQIMPLTKHLSQKWRTKDGTVWALEYKKCCILCKNCMHVIYCVWWVVLSSRPMGLRDCCIVCCSIADVNSVWGLDLRQTGRQSLSSQQPTSLSATLAVTKSIMFSLLCHFQHHGGLWIFLSFPFCLDIYFFPFIFFTALLELNGVFSPGNMPSKERKGLPIRKPRVKILLHSGWEMIVVFGIRWEMIMVMSLPASTRRQSIPQCCWYPWPSCYGYSLRIPHDLSRSLLSVVVSCG